MFLEIRHLRSLLAIQNAGNLARAAERLHLTQSALSHQIKAVENYFDTPLFLRNHKPLRMTDAGQRLVTLAEQLVPAIENMEQDLKRMAKGEAGRLHITIECHACFEWLLPVLDQFRVSWPEVEIDIRLGMSFDPIPALQRGEVDLVVSSDPNDEANVTFEPLFDYQALLAVAKSDPLASKAYIEPDDLADQSLITYPVERSRLDVFTRFLEPAGVEPANVRQTELTAIILQLVASHRGVAVLPDWVLSESRVNSDIAARPLGKEGMHGSMYAAIRDNDVDTAFMQDFISLARESINNVR